VVPPADRFRARWLAHFPPEAAAAAAAAFDDLVARYAEPHRAYHTFVHIATCLGLLDTVAAQLRDPRAVELALWFHDVIYDTHAKDNEARSADYARDVLSRLGAAPALVDRVAQLVQLTAHPSVPRDGDEEALLDIDLSTLGADADAYAEYAAAIRREYQWVPEDVFRRERGRLLEGFLAQRLFHSRHFGALLEERARRNLEWEIAQLRQ
jgi:predicted metal-dependent HD superfamily phosphohydrolase